MSERRAAILEYLLAQGQATIDELCSRFPDASSVTIRRDLVYLEEAGAIIRFHGGARANVQESQLEPFYYVRESENPALKEKLAVLAASFIDERRALFIDSGTTTMAFAKELPDKNLTIVTTAPNIALHVAAKKPRCSVILTGGTVNRNTLSCSGLGSAETLSKLNVDIAFMGASGYSQSAGFTAGEYFESELKRLVLSKAEKVVMLIDSSKIGKNMPYTFANPEDIHVLVTDTGLPPEIEAVFVSKGVQVVKAEP